MTTTVLTHDAPTNAFTDADSDAVTTNDGAVSFDIDDTHVVTVDAPSDFEAAFGTDRFVKIDGATIARPIKQTYVDGGERKTYKKPAEELRKAAYTADNKAYPLTHPDSGVVRNVDDVHGFWRKPRYDDEDDRLKADLYVPHNDEQARDFLREHNDVSVGFYNRIVPKDEYDGDTGELTDEDGVDGYQTDMFIDHVAGVETGRCPSEAGCGLDVDSHTHGAVVDTDVDTNMTDGYDIAPSYDGAVTLDYRNSEDRYFAVGPDENPDDEPKYPINNCEDARDAWNLRTQGDIDISVSALEERIKLRASELNCSLPSTAREDGACGCGTTTGNDTDNNDNTITMSNDFDLPDLSVDAIAEQHDAVAELRDERDELKNTVDEMEADVRQALDSAENFNVSLDDDECPCEAVETLVDDLDEKAERVDDLESSLEDYEADAREEKLDELGQYLDDEELSEYEDASLDEIESEIDRVETLVEKMDDADLSTIKGTPSSTTDSGSDNSGEREKRQFGRGYHA